MPKGHLTSSPSFSGGDLSRALSGQTCYGAIVTEAVMFQRSWVSWRAGITVTT